jgi:biopolymer transport protein ExbD
MSDIALLLLIFFVITTQFLVQRSLEVELPSITPEKDQETKKLITVYVKGDAVLLDMGGGEERVTVDQVAPYLSARLIDATRPEDRAVILDGESGVRFELMARVLNEIKRAGGIVTMLRMEE